MRGNPQTGQYTLYHSPPNSIRHDRITQNRFPSPVLTARRQHLIQYLRTHTNFNEHNNIPQTRHLRVSERISILFTKPILTKLFPSEQYRTVSNHIASYLNENILSDAHRHHTEPLHSESKMTLQNRTH